MKKFLLNRFKNLVEVLETKIPIDYLPQSEWEKYYMHSESVTHLYSNQGLDSTPGIVKEYFEKCQTEWRFDKFYFIYNETCTVEPISGWVVNKKMQFIPQSLWNNYVNNIKPSYLRFKLSNRKKVYLESAIILSYAWNNYWHFYNDILGQLKIANDFKVPLSVPIVVNCGLENANYFKQIVKESKIFNERKWIFQEKDTEIVCESVHLFNTFWAHKENFDYVVNSIGLGAVSTSSNRRIFISRKSARGRNITNIAEVKRVLNNFNFEIVECDDMTVQQQADLFSNSLYVIGIHGAGLTNIVYRRGKEMSLLEIFSKDFFNPPYFWMCQQYGYSYHSMVAGGSDTPDDPNGNFSISIDELERRIAHMIQ
ncbi:glycosyltransferase family 61 protein [Hymenobacter sp. ISL-91]|uniref:glycosyltransferase family 61 protein n=1 Tax=Hymenobacter sp. ISL-91 TaxID=2819151 RepID=UPI001BEACED6|nr:glycosyltransferase family 61 protein [Hymenobacter sp. ISL-91]MBT2558541.1 glycosyltransferase family 61 protein [Hymenobacter sp. ISL-91]